MVIINRPIDYVYLHTEMISVCNVNFTYFLEIYRAFFRINRNRCQYVEYNNFQSDKIYNTQCAPGFCLMDPYIVYENCVCVCRFSV